MPLIHRRRDLILTGRQVRQHHLIGQVTQHDEKLVPFCRSCGCGRLFELEPVEVQDGASWILHPRNARCNWRNSWWPSYISFLKGSSATRRLRSSTTSLVLR